MGLSKESGLYRGLSKVGSWYAVSRIVQILAMVVVTRKLGPDDFAIMAAIGAVQGMIGRFTSVNLYAELVRSKDLCQRQLTVAWSYETLRNILLAGILVVGAPWIAGWIDRPEAAAVFRISALGLVIASFNSPRMLELRRDSKFGLLGALESVAPIVYAISAVAFVMIQPDYWSLVWAGLVASAAFMVATHVWCRWRPRLDFHWLSMRPLLAFGLVLQVNSICGALRQHGLVYILILYGLNDEMGFYNRAVAFSLALGLQATGLVWKVAYPHFSQAERDGGCSLTLARSMQSRWILIGLPVAVLAAIAGQWLVPIILGEQWASITISWAFMVVGSVFIIANAPLASAFQSSRNEYSALVLPILTTVVQLGSGFALVWWYGLNGAGAAIFLGALAGVIVSRMIARRLISRAGKHDDTNGGSGVGELYAAKPI